MKAIFLTMLGYALRTLMLLLPITSFADDQPLLIHAARVFDGYTLKTNHSVLIINGKIAKVAPRTLLQNSQVKTLELGDTTVLPGLIELHAHLNFQHVPADIVLQHGITTLRDVGGNVHAPYGGVGRLRVLSSGKIITAVNGYPIPQMGADNIAIPVAHPIQARQAVRDLIAGGASFIKIALEPGQEQGAPWSAGHHHQHSSEHSHAMTAALPLLSEDIVKAIVDEAHQQHRKVTAHVAERKGVTIALRAGVDEWAHTPCEPIPESLLKQAVAQSVTIISTLDTLSKCMGITDNMQTWAKLGGKVLYGAEIAHPDIPWGIDAQELNLLMHLAHLSPLETLQRATAKSGQYLNIPLLGTLQTGAPADLIAVQGDITKNFKALEYPKLVISGGQIVVEK